LIATENDQNIVMLMWCNWSSEVLK